MTPIVKAVIEAIDGFVEKPAHTCSCGCVFSLSAWEALPLVGYTPSTEDPEGPLLELRNCEACASTCARIVVSLRVLVRSVNAELRTLRMRIALESEHPERERTLGPFPFRDLGVSSPNPVDPPGLLEPADSYVGRRPARPKVK